MAVSVRCRRVGNDAQNGDGEEKDEDLTALSSSKNTSRFTEH